MKTCLHCGEPLVISKFFPGKKYCGQKCSAAYLHKQRWANPEYRAKANERTRQAGRDRVARGNKVKMASGCVDCGYNANPLALQFDHIPGRGKKVNSPTNIHCPKKWEAEIAKCEVVCANCHHIRTHARLSQPSP
jgi:hypothetical protein